MKRPRTAMLEALLLLLITTLSTTPADADEVRLVSRQATSVEIHDADLLPPNPQGSEETEGPKTQILGFTDPVHGTLGHAGEIFTYLPGDAFRASGFDHFEVDYGQAGQSQPEGRLAVFLVADLKATPLHVNPVSGLPATWTEVDPDHLLEIETDPTTGKPTLWVTTTTPGAYVFLDTAPPPPARGDGGSDQEPDSGGTTVFELDDGGGATDISVSRVVGPTGPAFEIRAHGGTLRARAKELDGGWRETTPIPFHTGHVEYTWWMAASPGSRDGGVFLVVEGEHVDTLVGIDNYGLVDTGPEIQFGALNPQGAVTQTVVVTDMQSWSSPRPPIYEPFFATGGEGDLSATWTDVLRPELVSLSPATAVSGSYGIVVDVPRVGGPAGLIDASADNEKRYGLRFELDASALAAGSHIAVTVASQDSGATPFQVEVRKHAGSLEVRASPGESNEPGSPPTAWKPLAAASTTIEALWWEATAGQPDTGGLMLWIDSQPAGALSLDNHGTGIDSVLLGATDLVGNSGGSLAFDDVVAWH